jgi:hypothetical protein
VGGEQGVDHRDEAGHGIVEFGEDEPGLGEAAGEVGLVQFPEQGFLAAEVVDDGALAQAELGRDVAEAGVGVAALGDVLGEHAQDGVAGACACGPAGHPPTIRRSPRLPP